MRVFLLNILRRLNLGVLTLWLHPKSYLARKGWFASFRKHQAVDKAGQPIPWYVYPLITFLAERLTPDMRVFEYGSGNSTQWYAQHAKEIVAVEHNPVWGEIVSRNAPTNCTLVIRQIEEGYANEIANHGQFDTIVIDGPERAACLEHSLPALTPKGVIVWDDSHREEYAEGIQYLIEAGFRELRFTGIRPTTYAETASSIFYRDNNCLGI